MADPWHVLDSGPGAFAYNMAVDEALLEWMPVLARPVLRFYAWTEPAASFGYFQHYKEVAQLTPLRPLVRRPTGGGIVPHDADWTYSVAIPTVHSWYSLAAIESYRKIHEWLLEAFSSLGVQAALAPSAVKTGPGQCFAGHERFDVLWRGRKIAGAAQRRTRVGLLIQGSVQPPSSCARRVWQDAMMRAGTVAMEVGWEPLIPAEAFTSRVQALASTKYSQAAYNQRR